VLQRLQPGCFYLLPRGNITTLPTAAGSQFCIVKCKPQPGVLGDINDDPKSKVICAVKALRADRGRQRNGQRDKQADRQTDIN
jgi:hypothetical protein